MAQYFWKSKEGLWSGTWQGAQAAAPTFFGLKAFGFRAWVAWALWQLSQPTSFRCAVCARDWNPPCTSSPTTWHPTQSGSLSWLTLTRVRNAFAWALFVQT